MNKYLEKIASMDKSAANWSKIYDRLGGTVSKGPLAGEGTAVEKAEKLKDLIVSKQRQHVAAMQEQVDKLPFSQMSFLTRHLTGAKNHKVTHDAILDSNLATRKTQKALAQIHGRNMASRVFGSPDSFMVTRDKAVSRGIWPTNKDGMKYSKMTDIRYGNE